LDKWNYQRVKWFIFVTNELIFVPEAASNRIMIKQLTYVTFLDALLRGDNQICRNIVFNLLENKVPVETIYFELFHKVLYKIGNMWERSQITIPTEHRATQIIDELISATLLKVESATKTGKTCVISCVDKEYHFLGAKMAAYIFELNGWKSHFLGASTPVKLLVNFIEESQPDVVGLSINFHLNYHRLNETLSLIEQKVPNQKVYLGGQAAVQKKGELVEKYKNLIVFESVKELNEKLKADS